MKNLATLKFFLIFTAIFLPRQIFSQSKEWTWVNGDNTINQHGVYDMQGMSSVINKPGARSEAACWKDKSGNFWLFGGVGYGHNNSWGSLNDLWKYNAGINEWVWLKGSPAPLNNGVYGIKGVASPDNNPGSRQMSASWTDAAGNLWLFGGSGSTYFNDLWKYDIITNEWTWMNGDNTGNKRGVYGSQGITSPLNQPGARNNAACWADNAGNLWLFGGNGYGATGGGGYLGDLWKYNITGNMWTFMKGDTMISSQPSYGNRGTASASNKPGSRTGASCWTDQEGNMWMFGGHGYSSQLGLLNDLWKYNVSTNQWAWIHGDNVANHYAIYGTQGTAAVSNRPGGTLNAVTWTDSTGSLWLFGGRGNTEGEFGELNALWKFNLAANQWTFVKGDRVTYADGVYGSLGLPSSANKPGCREDAVTWTDSLGNLWMFGGESYPANSTVTYFRNDLWKFSSLDLLPVSLISFDGILQDKNILLNWLVEKEMNFDHYEIEKSYNGAAFELLGKVNATGKGNYNYVDYGASASGKTLYYRLKMVDIDGKFNYSNIIKFNTKQTPGYTLYPNPAKDFTKINFNENINDKIQIKITDMMGRIMLKNQINVNGNYCIIPTNTLIPGNYAVTIIYQGKTAVESLVIIK